METPITSPRLSRRAWTLLFSAIPLFGQALPPVAASAPETPQQKQQKATADVSAVSNRLAQTEVAMDVEPAFAFRA